MRWGSDSVEFRSVWLLYYYNVVFITYFLIDDVQVRLFRLVEINLQYPDLCSVVF